MESGGLQKSLWGNCTINSPFVCHQEGSKGSYSTVCPIYKGAASCSSKSTSLAAREQSWRSCWESNQRNEICFQAHQNEGLSSIFCSCSLTFWSPCFLPYLKEANFILSSESTKRIASNVIGNQNFFICELRISDTRTNFSLVLLKCFLLLSETLWLIKSLSVTFSFSELFAKKIIKIILCRFCIITQECNFPPEDK